MTLEVKPWDDETDLAAMEAAVRSIEQPGLVWGASKFVAVGFGIKKLQITLVVGTLLSTLPEIPVLSCCSRASSRTEDELVSLDELQDKIAEFEDYVQSSDIAAMQKL